MNKLFSKTKFFVVFACIFSPLLPVSPQEKLVTLLAENTDPRLIEVVKTASLDDDSFFCKVFAGQETIDKSTQAELVKSKIAQCTMELSSLKELNSCLSYFMDKFAHDIIIQKWGRELVNQTLQEAFGEQQLAGIGVKQVVSFYMTFLGEHVALYKNQINSLLARFTNVPELLEWATEFLASWRTSYWNKQVNLAQQSLNKLEIEALDQGPVKQTLERLQLCKTKLEDAQNSVQLQVLKVLMVLCVVKNIVDETKQKNANNALDEAKTA